MERYKQEARETILKVVEKTLFLKEEPKGLIGKLKRDLFLMAMLLLVDWKEPPEPLQRPPTNLAPFKGPMIRITGYNPRIFGS